MRVAFSSHSLPPAERAALLREVYARSMIGCDLAPVGEGALEIEFDALVLNGAGVGGGRYAPMTAQRGTEHMTGEGIMLSASAGRFGVSVGGAEMLAGGEGAVTAMPMHRPSRWLYPGAQAVASVWIGREALADVAPGLDLDTPRVLAPGTPALALLMAYAQLLRDTPPQGAAAALAGAHLADLAALALGHRAGPAAGRAARLAAIRRDMAARFRDPDLGVASLARRHGITPRYLQMLFAGAGESAAEALLGLRLEAARARLADPRRAAEGIGTVAFACGFHDLSTFNRGFRRRFGTTPGEYRAAMRGGPASG